MPEPPTHPITELPPDPRTIRPGQCRSCATDLTALSVGDSCPKCGQPIQGLCRGCGYDLSGLSVSGVCPECGRAVADSLRGDLLAFAAPAYLATLHRGLILILASILFMVATAVIGFVFAAVATTAGTGRGTMVQLVHYASSGAGLLGTVLSVYGWYLFTSPDPGRYVLDRADRPRRVLRASVITSAAVSVTTSVLQIIEPAVQNPWIGRGTTGAGLVVTLATVLILAGLALWVVMFFAAMRYLQWLAMRIPNTKHARTAARYVWLLPVIYVPGMALCGLGPLIALVLYYNLLNEFRKSVRAIRNQVGEGAAIA